MSVYEQRLDQDLQDIRTRVLDMGAALETALDGAVRSMLRVDRELAAEVILRDLAINRSAQQIESACHAFVARHLPAAGHLRFISSVLHCTVALERVGDYAVTICREVMQVSGPPPPTVARDIEMMADQCKRLFQQSVKAFQKMSADLAMGTKAMAIEVITTFHKILDDLIAEGERGSLSVKDLLALLVVFNRLERVSDQASNICERVAFAATGTVKEPRVRRVLFVDRRNDGVSLLAEHLARKAYPESCHYESAGWEAADAPTPALLEFMDHKGLGHEGVEPRQLMTIHEDLIDYDVIIDLEGGLRQQLPDVPFRTVILRWPVNDGADDGLDLEAAFRDLTVRIRELVEVVRGPDAH